MELAEKFDVVENIESDVKEIKIKNSKLNVTFTIYQGIYFIIYLIIYNFKNSKYLKFILIVFIICVSKLHN
ncbi:hypothetical protein [Clostridium uliginosum]|uniref:Uncharacterized protein n=1 Tax=Clostridium uliginosum TaxID=119641 RepID=A0A1I1HB43_9CLOT|nr:hypothetical protein [Clostridium uliginosum]SFC21369.1 hypothetical protein SAMN05421842_101252 [Clostridium uliginosum]